MTNFKDELAQLLGLQEVDYHHNLSKEQLFHEAIANDRGRVSKDGPDDAQKAYPTKLGVDGPLLFYADPSCNTDRSSKAPVRQSW